MQKCCIVGTWPFSLEAVRTACEIVQQCVKTADEEISIIAVERGINKIECDDSYGDYFVGRGGVRNKCGDLELDAGIMNGNQLNYGAVTALKGFENPISVARKVMERSRHSVLTSDGAQQFAIAEGFSVDKELLTTKLGPRHAQKGHDTLGLICLVNGGITVGVSTSGMGGKEAGRVGDSAISGSGLYADNDGGAACCSGDGDEIIKHCPAIRVVQYMKAGLSAQTACDKVTQEINKRSLNPIELVIIGIDIKGNIGAGSTLSEWTDPKTHERYPGFPYVIWTEQMTDPQVLIKPSSLS